MKMKEKLSIQKLLGVKNLENDNIILSFVFLRFLATCFITNSHYKNVYPLSSLAVGGLLGDVLFFIISGFVLSIPSLEKFFPWYLKRIKRILPAFIFGIFYYHITCYSFFSFKNWFTLLIFPTDFVFTTTIIILYIPFFFVQKIKSPKNFMLVYGSILISYMLTYIFLFDKSTYEMNNTKHYMIFFLYFIAMLGGAYLRKFDFKFKFPVIISSLITFVFLTLYYVATNLIRNNPSLFPFQIVVTITLLLSIFLLTNTILQLDNTINKFPKWLLNTINYIASLTLEIYIIQRPIILALENISFPLNWLIITVSILAGATILKLSISLVNLMFSWIFLSIFSKKIKNSK